MAFIDTFLAVFTATIIGQIAAWWFKRELEHRIENGYNKIKNRFKNNGGNNMTKLSIDIEAIDDGMWNISVFKEGTGFLGAKMQPKLDYIKTFKDLDKLEDWLQEKLTVMKR